MLVIGADTFSTITGPDDAVNRAIFGDGAGAFVLSAGSPGDAGALGASHLGSDGALEHLIQVPAGGSAGAHPTDPPFFQMQGREVFSAAVAAMVESCRKVAERESWSMGDIAWVIPHQANRRIIKNVATALGAKESRIVMHLDEVGNTSAASIPLALARHHDQFRASDKILLTAFGGGLTWGALALTWPAHVMPISTISMNEHQGRAES